MKKLLVLLLIAFMVCGCSTAKTEEGNNTSEIIVTPTENTGDEGALKANTTKRTLTFGGSPDRSLSTDITRENNDFLQLIAYIEDVLYGDIPQNADYPAVKYLPGEWIYCICGYENNFGSHFYDLGYAELDMELQQDVMNIELRPRLYWEADEIYPEEDSAEGNPVYSGTRVASDSYYALEDYYGNILCVYCYYRYNGMEYVMAELWVSEESYADVLLYRSVQQ